MAMHAFHRVEYLAAETQARSQAVSRAGDVHSLDIAGLIRSSRRVVSSTEELRTSFIEATAEIGRSSDQLKSCRSFIDLAEQVVELSRAVKRMSKPMLANNSGLGMLSAAEAIDDINLPMVADRRIARRLAKRIRESAGTCEHQRQRFIAKAEMYLSDIYAFAETSGRTEDLEAERKEALRRSVVKRYPVINAYLAR